MVEPCIVFFKAYHYSISVSEKFNILYIFPQGCFISVQYRFPQAGRKGLLNQSSSHSFYLHYHLEEDDLIVPKTCFQAHGHIFCVLAGNYALKYGSFRWEVCEM